MQVSNNRKITIAKTAMEGYYTIKDTATMFGVSVSTVRRYMDQWTNGELKLDVLAELEEIRIHISCMNMDTGAEVTQRRKEVLLEKVNRLIDNEKGKY